MKIISKLFILTTIVSLQICFPFNSTAKEFSRTRCDAGYLEVEGASPKINTQWMPKIGVDFRENKGSKTRTVGFAPKTKTSFSILLKKPGTSKFKKVSKKTFRYDIDLLYRGAYVKIDEKHFKTAGYYGVKVLMEGVKTPNTRLECFAEFSTVVK